MPICRRTSNRRSVPSAPRGLAALLAAAASLAAPTANAAGDGSDGAFAPSGNVTLTLPDDGVFNFTTIDVPAGVTVRFSPNAANTPAFLLATGDVHIDGTLAVSQWRTSNAPGLGGFAGGAGGLGDETCVTTNPAACKAATPGLGLAGGLAGDSAHPGGIKSTPGHSGSGGGMATRGLAATKYTPSAPPSAIAGFPDPLVGGSGGGGGGGWMFFGVELGGGSGGGGGGAVRIDAGGSIALGATSSILADGANGGWAFTNIGGTGGPGGGGSGGNVDLVASQISIDPAARIHARGGFGGGLSTQPYDINPPSSWISYENGARGGFGGVRLQAASIDAPFTALDAGAFGIPGSAASNPLLPLAPGAGAPWQFAPVVLSESAMGRQIPIWFDPQPALGYAYDLVAGPSFRSVVLPSGIGDDLYDLYLANPATGTLELALSAQGGTEIDFTRLEVFGSNTPTFPNGVAAFEVLGIEPGSGVDFGDPAAFPTGLTFTDAGAPQVRMTPIPEPATAAAVALGLALIGARARRAAIRGT